MATVGVKGLSLVQTNRFQVPTTGTHCWLPEPGERVGLYLPLRIRERFAVEVQL